MAFKGGVVLGPVSLNATGSGTTNIAGTSNSGTVSIGNGSSAAVTIGCGTAGISVGATANAHSSTFGSTNSTSSTTVQSGSGALNVTSTNGALTINSGTGTLSISNDATNATVNIATGNANKIATLGSTNGASSLALKYGTADFSLASATGNVMVAQDTGEINYPLQPAFLAYLSASVTDVTGDATIYTILFNSTIFDQNSDFNTSTGQFTAPVTGRYQLNMNINAQGFLSAHTNGNANIFTSNSNRLCTQGNWFALSELQSGNNNVIWGYSILVDMDAADVAEVRFQVAGGTKVIDVIGTQSRTSFSGHLVC